MSLAEAPCAVPFAGDARLAGAFAGVTPWSGTVEAGRVRNFMGVLLPEDIRTDLPARRVAMRCPTLADGEGFAEWYSIRRAVARAEGRFTMVSLGAHYGGPLVDAVFMLRAVRPMPFRLVGVEGDPYMCAALHRHFAANGVGEASLTLVNAVVAADNRPVLFPVAKTRTGANRMLGTPGEIEALCKSVAAAGQAPAVLGALLQRGTSDLRTILPGTGVEAELRLASAVTLADVLGPLDRVDHLEIDIQSAESDVLPPFMELIRRRVGWIHLGTHGRDRHRAMADLFRGHGFGVHIDWEPMTDYDTPDGPFRTGDGVLAIANPAFD